MTPHTREGTRHPAHLPVYPGTCRGADGLQTPGKTGSYTLLLLVFGPHPRAWDTWGPKRHSPHIRSASWTWGSGDSQSMPLQGSPPPRPNRAADLGAWGEPTDLGAGLRSGQLRCAGLSGVPPTSDQASRAPSRRPLTHRPANLPTSVPTGSRRVWTPRDGGGDPREAGPERPPPPAGTTPLSRPLPLRPPGGPQGPVSQRCRFRRDPPRQPRPFEPASPPAPASARPRPLGPAPRYPAPPPRRPRPPEPRLALVASPSSTLPAPGDARRAQLPVPWASPALRPRSRPQEKQKGNSCRELQSEAMEKRF